MKTIAFVRKVDDLGRIVLPIELRRKMDIGIHDALEIAVEGDKLVLKKYEPSCIFCGSKEEIVSVKDRCVCKKCLEDLKTR